MKVGEAKLGSSKKFFKMEDGDNVYRILPALGELADKGIWSKYYKVCWGYKNSEGRMKLFQDCRVVNRETKMVEVESAAYQRVEQLRKAQSDIVDKFKAGQATQEQVKQVRELSMRFNIEGKHYVNAVNLNGEIGLLKIGHKAKLQLDDIIKSLREKEAKNPLAIENGLYINFYRTGKGRDTIYKVDLYKQKVQANVNGQTMLIEQEVSHTMDAGFISRLDAEAFELNNMYPAPTSEEISEIVNGGPEDLDRIIAKYKGDKSKPASVEDVVKSASTPAPTNTAPNTQVDLGDLSTSAPSAQEELSQTTATSADLGTQEADSTPTETPAPAAATPAPGSSMSNEDFLASIGAEPNGQ